MSNLAAVSRNPNQLDVFNCRDNGHVYTSWWTFGSDWSGLNEWRDIGGIFPKGAPVTAVSRNPDQLDLFICGDNGHVYTSWWTAGSDWSGLNNNWRDIGGIFPKGAPVAAVSRNPDQLDLFICGDNGHVYTSWWTAGSDWSGLNNNWRDIGGIFPKGAPVAAVSRNPDQLDLFICGDNGHVYTSWWTAGSDWSGLNNNWRDIGGIFPKGAPVAAVSRNPDQLDLFICGDNGGVHTSWWTAGSDWSGLNNNWRDIGGIFPKGAPVTAVSRNPDQLDLLIYGNNGGVHTSWWTAGSDWSGLNNNWRDIGGIFPKGAPVTAVSRNPDRLDLLIYGNNGHVYTSWWTFGSDWSGLNNSWRDIGPGAMGPGVNPNAPLHFDTGPLTTSDLALGGSAHFVVDRKGNFTLSTHAHDSGFTNIRYLLGVVLLCTNGQAAFGIGVPGRVEGTTAGLPFGTPDRNEDKTLVGNDRRIAEQFDDIVAGAALVGRLDGEDVFLGGLQDAIGEAFKEALKSFGTTFGHEVALLVLHGAKPPGSG